MQKELQNKLTRVESPDGFTGLLELSQDEIRLWGKEEIVDVNMQR